MTGLGNFHAVPGSCTPHHGMALGLSLAGLYVNGVTKERAGYAQLGRRVHAGYEKDEIQIPGKKTFCAGSGCIVFYDIHMGRWYSLPPAGTR